MNASLFLIGFMGSGKSTVGPVLADLLGLTFIDLDDRIRRLTGLPISEIFAQGGESSFRTVERQTLAGFREFGVIALGAGAFMFPENRIFCRQHGTTIFLDWPLSTLISRVGMDPGRPLWGTRSVLKHLYSRRRPVYRASDLIWRPKPPYSDSVSETAAGLFNCISKTDLVSA